MSWSVDDLDGAGSGDVPGRDESHAPQHGDDKAVFGARTGIVTGGDADKGIV